VVKRACLALAWPAFLALWLAPHASAGWTSPFDLASAPATDVALATSPSRGAAVAWRDSLSGEAWVRRLDADGRLGPPLLFSADANGSAPLIGLASSGAAVIVWSRFDSDGRYTLLARRVTARGRLGRIRELGRGSDVLGEGLSPQLAVDAAGNATVIWNRRRGYDVPHDLVVTRSTLHLRRIDADGSLGPVVDLPAEGGLNQFARLAIEPSGRAVLVWVHEQDGLFGLRARLVGRDGRLGAGRDLSVPTLQPITARADAAIGSDGTASITWAAPSESGVTVVLRQLSPRGLGRLRAVTPVGSFSDPRVEVAEDGSAMVAWLQARSGSNEVVAARRLRIDGRLGNTRLLSPPAPHVSEPALAADDLGRLTIVWVRLLRDGISSSVEARAFARDHHLGPIHILSVGERPSPFTPPVLVADAREVVTAAWVTLRSDLFGLRAARYVP
jgi:hypothetical protein